MGANLCVLSEKYSEPEWTRVYTNRCNMQDIGAGVYTKLFSQNVAVGSYMSNFEAEIFVI